MEMTLYGVALVPAVLGIVEVAKQVGLATRFAPVLSLFLGVGAGFLVSPLEPRQAVVTGIAIGLAASGLYSGARAVIEDEQS